MTKTKRAARVPMPPLETGQVWCMDGMNLQVGLVGKLLVHYKLAKPAAVRIPNSVSGKATIEKFLKKNKATLAPVAKAPKQVPNRAGLKNGK